MLIRYMMRAYTLSRLKYCPDNGYVDADGKRKKENPGAC